MPMHYIRDCLFYLSKPVQERKIRKSILAYEFELDSYAILKIKTLAKKISVDFSAIYRLEQVLR